MAILELAAFPSPSSLGEAKAKLSARVRNDAASLPARWQARVLDEQDREVASAGGLATIAEGESTLEVPVPLAEVPPGTLATVSASAGSIAEADADPGAPGLQVRLSNARSTLTLVAPTEPGIVWVTARSDAAGSLGLTRILFTTTDPNQNGQPFCAGDLRRIAWAPGDDATGGRYDASLDLDADGQVDEADLTAGLERWRGLDRPAAATGSAPPRVAVLLRGEWEEAAVGTTLQLRIDVRSSEPVSGVEVELEYDPGALALGEPVAGEHLAEGTEVELLGPLSRPGRLALGLLRRDRDDRGVVGEATAFVVPARVLAAGPMGLSLAGAIAAGPDGRDLPVELVAADHTAAGAPPAVLRGDANDDGKRDISDAISILGCLFLGGECPPSLCAGDANRDGNLDICDAVSLLSYLFLGGAEPAPCP